MSAQASLIQHTRLIQSHLLLLSQWNASRTPLSTLQKGFTRPCRYACCLSSHFLLKVSCTDRGDDFTAAVTEVSHCVVSTGSGDQGHNPDPHHGVPLWDRHAGHQTGVYEELWKVTVHCHLSKSHKTLYVLYLLFINKFELNIDFVVVFLRVIPPGITRSCYWSCAVVATKREGRQRFMRTQCMSTLKQSYRTLYHLWCM